jgi:hypothetical protein
MSYMRRAIGLALALAVLAAQPAAATFPGRNGDLLVTHHSGSKYMDQRLTLVRVHPRTGAERRIPICTYQRSVSWGLPPSCILAGAPAASPDGRSVAVIGVDWPDNTDLTREWSLRVISLEDGSQERTSLGRSAPPVPLAGPVVRWASDPGELLILRAMDPVDDRENRWDPTVRGRAVVIGRDGSERAPLADDVQSPDVAADGRLAFVRHGEIYAQAPNGSHRRRTWNGGDQPSWSPGGRFLAFTRRGDVHVMPASTGRPRRVARGTDPVWSPNGERIAFRRGRRIFVLDRASGRVRRVSGKLAVGYEGTAGLDWQPLVDGP